MKTTIRFFFFLLVAVMLAFGNISPSLADDAPPPDKADIATLARVVDLWAGSGQSNPEYLITSAGGGLWFAADANNGLGRELWTYTSFTGAIPVDVVTGVTGSSPEHLAYYNNAIYFSAEGYDGAGRELWRFDWVNGAQRVTDINPGAGTSLPKYMTVYNNILYFSAFGNDGAGAELWKYDPVNGAQRVTDINPGGGNSYPKYLAVYNGALYFQADNGNGAELWKYTVANGAQLVADIYPGNGGSFPSYLAAYDNALYFSAFGDIDTGQELWMYDEEFGPQQVADIKLGIDGSYPSYLTAYNGALYFQADGNDSAGPELWMYNPVNGADRVADIYSGATGSFPMHMAVYNGALYFNANNGDGLGYELWKYDNTVTATFRSAKTHDGWVLESGETSNAGGTLNNSAATFNLGDDAQDKQYRGILSFNTSTLPDNAVIISATLRIRQQGVMGGNPFSTHGNIAVDIRKGPFGTNALQVSDFEAAPSRANVGTIKNQSVNNWFSTALTKAGYPFINLLGVTQFRLRFATDDNNDNGADFLRFFSADTANMSDYPTLEVKYYIP